VRQQRDQKPDRIGRDDCASVRAVGSEFAECVSRVRLAIGIAMLQQRLNP
jgi:hypothetical protein